jgi:hypothetical protein
MNEEISTFDTEDDLLPQNERPVFLKVLCILSWINAGLWILLFTFFKLFVNDEVASQAIEMQKTDEEKKALEFSIQFLEQTSLPFLLLYLISIISVYMMWEMKKKGFMIYAPLHLVIILVPYFVMPFSISDFLFSFLIVSVFIGMYTSNLKYMKS